MRRLLGSLVRSEVGTLAAIFFTHSLVVARWYFGSVQDMSCSRLSNDVGKSALQYNYCSSISMKYSINSSILQG
jgi:hypothetical protein